MKRQMFMDIPCGRVLGHGLACCEGYMCSQCEYILQLEAALDEMREALAGVVGKLPVYEYPSFEPGYLTRARAVLAKCPKEK